MLQIDGGRLFGSAEGGSSFPPSSKRFGYNVPGQLASGDAKLVYPAIKFDIELRGKAGIDLRAFHSVPDLPFSRLIRPIASLPVVA